MNDLDLSRFRGMARDVQTICGMNGWTLTPDIDKALALAAEAKRVARELPMNTTVETDPTKPTDVDKWVTKEATRRTDTATRQIVADELATRLDLAGIRAALAYAPRVLENLCEQFDENVARFAAVADTAPTEVTGATTPEEFAAFSTVAKSADALTRGASFRARVAQMVGEDEVVIRQPIWLILAPRDDASLFDAQELVNTYSHGDLPTSTEEWRKVCAVGALMARQDEGTARMQRHVQAMWNSGQASDGGMLDKPYAEAVRAEFGAGALVAGQPSVDRW